LLYWLQFALLLPW